MQPSTLVQTDVVTSVTTTTTTDATSLTVTTSVVTTVLPYCAPTEAVQNGGFESGALSPFTFQSNPTIFGTSGGSASIINNNALAHSGNYLL